jgi:hypothetical protein
MVREGNVEDVECHSVRDSADYGSLLRHIPEGNVRAIAPIKFLRNLRQTSPLPYPLWG